MIMTYRSSNSAAGWENPMYRYFKGGGNCLPNRNWVPRYIIFCALSKDYQHCCGKLPEANCRILVNQAVLELLIKTKFCTKKKTNKQKQKQKQKTKNSVNVFDIVHKAYSVLVWSAVPP